MKISEFNQTMAYLLRPEPRQMLAKGTQPRTAAGTFGKVYSMAEIRKLAKELNVSEFVDGVKLDPDKFRSNVTKAKARTDFYKNQFKSLSPKKQKEFKKDFMKQIAKHQDGGFYISAANRVPNAKLVKKYFPKANDANKIVTSINGILLNEFKNKGNVIKTSPKANANAIRMEDLRKITDPSFETAEGVQGTKGTSLQHVASKNRMVKLNNLAYLEKVLNSSLSQNDKRIKIIENEVDRLIKAKPKNYIQRINDLNTEGMALASGYIKKDGKIIKGPTAGYSEFRVKDPINQKEYFFGKDDAKTILPDKDSVLIQEDADLIDKPVKDFTPDERKRAIEIAKKKQIEFKKVKGLIPFMKDLGIKCQLSKGINCMNPQAYEKSLNQLSKAAQAGDEAAAAKMANFTKAVRGAGGVIKGVLGPAAIAFEVGVAVPFGLFEYAQGKPTDEIINTLTYGLAGTAREDKLKKLSSDYGVADKADEKFAGYLSTLNRLGEYKDPYNLRPGKRITEEEVLKTLQPFYRPSPQSEQGEFFDEDSLNRSRARSRAAEQKLYDEDMERKKQRTQMFDLSNPFMAAGGGIAKEAGDPSGAMLESMNPDSQGLSGLLKRVKKG